MFIKLDMACYYKGEEMSQYPSWKTAWSWPLFGLQALCILLLITEEVMSSFLGEQPGGLLENDKIEMLIIVALVVGLVASGNEIRKSLSRQRRLEQQIKAASGEFATLLEEHFENWGLTLSESDVALLSLKGFSIAEMAAIRKTAEGTIKAQCNAIYRKAGVSGRPQLLSLFLDELLQGVGAPERAA